MNLLGPLASGVLSVLLVAGVQSATDGIDEDASGALTLGVGRVGDRLQFDFYAKVDEGGWSVDPPDMMEIGSVHAVAAPDGQIRRAFSVIVSNADGTQVHDIDLETGRELRAVAHLKHPALAFSYFQGLETEPVFPYWGQTLRTGQDLSRPEGGGTVNLKPSVDDQGGRLALSYGLERSPDDSVGETGRAWVDAPGEVDGKPGIGVHSQMRIETPSQWAAWQERDPENRRIPPVDVRMAIDTVEWVAEGSAYPRHITIWGRTQTPDQTSHLDGIGAVTLSPGAGEVLPWRTPSLVAAPTFASALTDGEGSRLPYPLALAQADIEGSPTLASYGLWARFHPSARLAAAEFGPDPHRDTPDRRAHRWTFVFSTGSSAHEVRTTRIQGLEAPLTESRDVTGDYEVPDASSFVTLAHAEAMWRSLAGAEYRDLPVTNLWWGRPPTSPTRPFYCFEPPGDAPVIDESLHPSPRRLLLGHASGGDCFTQDDTLRASMLLLDAADASPLAAYELSPAHPSDAEPVAAPENPPARPLVTQAGAGFGGFGAWVLAFAAGAFLYYVPRVLPWLATPLLVFAYSKLTRDQVLDHKVRDDLLRFIQAQPGLTANELKRVADLGWGNTVYHLGILERHRLIRAVPDGARRRYVPAELRDPVQVAHIVALRNERARGLFARITGQPGVTTHELAQGAGVTLAGAIWNLRRLEHHGLVRRAREGGSVRYYPAA